jgi:hypothetical protein
MWTAHKARFIERYLYYFVQVTKHGTYIDGFAGPQQPDDADMWTAKWSFNLILQHRGSNFLGSNEYIYVHKLI